MKEIFILKHGITIIVDDEDYNFCVGFGLSLSGKYVRAYNKEVNDNLQRILAKRIGLNLSGDIDHKNGDRFDFRRENLRAATRRQNLQNRGKAKHNKSGFKGVFAHGLLWRAKINVNGKQVHLGTFSTREMAAEAYRLAAIKYHGEFARYS